MPHNEMPRGLLQLLKSNEVGSHSCNRVSHVEQTVDDRVREVTVNKVASRSLSSCPLPGPLPSSQVMHESTLGLRGRGSGQ